LQHSASIWTDRQPNKIKPAEGVIVNDHSRSRIDFDPGPLRQISAHQADDRWTLVYRQHFAHPPQAVWGALTDPDQLPAWAPFTADRDLGSTGPVILISIDSDEQRRQPATVTIAEPPRLLEYDWGGQVLHWELAAEGDGTDLVLQHTIDDRQDLSRMAAGWHLCLLVCDDHLSGGSLDPIVGMRAMDYGWADLEQDYRGTLGS
jgi:uncharacterized protein YndB with AHSA1/START domain